MQRFSEIIAGIAAAVAAMATAITTVTRTVVRPAFIAGRWTLRAATEVVLLPARAVAAAFSGGLAVAPQAEDAAQKTAEQIKTAAAQQERALTAQQATRLIIRAARMRADGRDIGDIAAAIPGNLGGYIRKLNTSECHRIAEMDANIILGWVSGSRPSLPGVRTQDELDGKVPAPNPTKTTTSDDKTLEGLARRILERRTQPKPAPSYARMGLAA